MILQNKQGLSAAYMAVHINDEDLIRFRLECIDEFRAKDKGAFV